MPPTIIQNAIRATSSGRFFMAPEDPTASIDLDFGQGVVLSIGGGLEQAWREPSDAIIQLSCCERYEEYLLTSEDSFEVIREKLLWRSGISSSEGIPIKEFHYLTLDAILEAPESLARMPAHFGEVVRYWHAQKQAGYVAKTPSS